MAAQGWWSAAAAAAAAAGSGGGTGPLGSSSSSRQRRRYGAVGQQQQQQAAAVTSAMRYMQNQLGPAHEYWWQATRGMKVGLGRKNDNWLAGQRDLRMSAKG